MSIMKRYFTNLYNSANKRNLSNILDMVEPLPKGKLCDLGCDDGEWTLRLGNRMQTNRMYGVDIVPKQTKLARRRKIKAESSDINMSIPFGDEEFDLVHANQVIEHLHATGNFLKEVHRVLKGNGRFIVSTENASSWHNILALLMGWQMFSLTNVYNVSGIGNPLALHRHKTSAGDSWQHMRVFSYRGLIELLEAAGFKVERVVASGYYPFPNWLARIDPRHGHFLAVLARKKEHK